MNMYHRKLVDHREELRISSPLRLENLNDCRMVVVGDADPNPGLHVFIKNYGYENWVPGKAFKNVSSSFILRYVIGGKGTYCGVPVSEGYCYLTVPGVEYEIVSDEEEPLCHVWVIFEGYGVMELLREVFGRIVPFAEPFSDCKQAISIIEEVLCGNFEISNEHYYHIGAFYRLLALHSPLPKPPANIHHHDFSMYLKAVDYIENEYNQKITVNEIAKRIHIVPSYLYRIFIKYGGVSPQQALVKKRMQMAAILLDQGQYTVSQVAEMTGYADSLQFSKFFKKHFSMSPTQYQKRN